MDCRVKPGNDAGADLFLIQSSQQPFDQRLRDALIGHRFEQFCEFVRAEMRGDLRIARHHVAQMLLAGDGLFGCGLDQMMRIALADRLPPARMLPPPP